MEFDLKLTGTKPMLQHNGRLANPLDQYTRALKELTGKRKKTDDDLLAIMQIEARGGCWQTADGLLGLPNAAVWACVRDAATKFSLGKEIKRALLLDDIVVPVQIDGEFISCDEWLKDPAHLDYRSVVISGRRVMRARPLLPVGWQSEHHFELLDDVMDGRTLVPILERAGRLIGLGDWRPSYGTFEPEIIQ